MTGLTKKQKNQARELVEMFRDAAFRDLDNDRGGPSLEQVETFVKLDTWLKLDEAEQARKAMTKPNVLKGYRNSPR